MSPTQITDEMQRQSELLAQVLDTLQRLAPKQSREAQTERLKRAQIFEAIAARMGAAPFTAGELIAAAALEPMTCAPLAIAIEVCIGTHDGNRSMRLGKWLSKSIDIPAGGFELQAASAHEGSNQYRLKFKMAGDGGR
ncbi:hypothetical protein [Roseateles sp.]|uniref:hypothetical protein n=1 Tax=Roseateles sp. TaxID=1971397 RepID=UPI00286A16E0|nr:hypothetical protein [Roseateles sp.]